MSAWLSAGFLTKEAGMTQSASQKKQMERHRRELLARSPSLAVSAADLDAAVDCIRRCFDADGTLLVCGNGGSAADAQHIVGELVKGFLLPRQLPRQLQDALAETWAADGRLLAGNLQCGLRALALTGPATLLTAIGNDQGAELIFAQQVMALGRSGDVLLAISTSGNAQNVVLAAKTARTLGLSVVALTGAAGGQLRAVADICISAPASVTHEVQEWHVPVYHCLCAMLEVACCQTDSDTETGSLPRR